MDSRGFMSVRFYVCTTVMMARIAELLPFSTDIRDIRVDRWTEYRKQTRTLFRQLKTVDIFSLPILQACAASVGVDWKCRCSWCSWCSWCSRRTLVSRFLLSLFSCLVGVRRYDDLLTRRLVDSLFRSPQQTHELSWSSFTKPLVLWYGFCTRPVFTGKKRDVCNDRVTIVWFVWYNGVSLMLFD